MVIFRGKIERFQWLSNSDAKQFSVGIFEHGDLKNSAYQSGQK